MSSNAQKMTGLAFDASQVAPSVAYDPIPPGWYNSEITDCEVVPVKGRGDNTRVKVEFTVIDGEHKGRKLFGSINNKNANAQCQEIGQKELSALCHAVNVIQVQDTTQFIGKFLAVKVKVKPADKEYDASNEPKAYKPLEGALPSGPTGPAFPQGPGVAQGPAFAQGPPQSVAPVIDFPPAGWIPHPQAPGQFYCGQEVLTEADLRTRYAPAAPVVAPVVVPVAPVVPAAPVVAPLEVFPPLGWMPHPQSPGFFYTATGQVMSEADLRASQPVAAPVVPVAPVVPAAPGVPAIPLASAAPGVGPDGLPIPPWAQGQAAQ